MNHDLRSDAEVIAASLRAPDEFREIYARHFDRIVQYVARRIGVDEADDVASEVFVRAFQLRGRYDTTKEDCLPWLYGFARNVTGDGLRGRLRRLRPLPNPEPVPSHESTTIDRVDAAQAVERLAASLLRLRSGDREALLLFAVEDLSYEEIGRILDIPTGTVGSRIARARKKVHEYQARAEQIASRGRLRQGHAEASGE